MANDRHTYIQLMKQLPPVECSHMERVADYAWLTALDMKFNDKIGYFIRMSST
ncbi:hypothetical protein LJR153_007325 [Paenibacillus sp. LjRoot153]|uniref:hypothetical protein n=1 Tax=Paenibacillus sp. LjRoot153 TaxID=3342270 RepID=UPI003ECEF5EF